MSVANLAIISVVELGSGILASSLATLKPLISSLQSPTNAKKSTGGIGSSGKPGKLCDSSANTGSESVTAVGTMQSDSIDLATGKLSSLSGHTKPWASVDVRPASSKPRRLFGIEFEGGSSYDGNAIFELPASGAAKHVSRTHDFALALPDPDAPSDDDDQYGLDLLRTSLADPEPRPPPPPPPPPRP